MPGCVAARADHGPTIRESQRYTALAPVHSDGALQTVKQLHERLPIALSRLYYHVGLLERYRLIHIAQTRMVSGIPEKYYQATVYKLSVDHALLSSSLAASLDTTGLDIFLSAVLEDTRKDIQRSVQEGLLDLSAGAPLERQLYLGRCWAQLSPQQVQQFRTRLEALVKGFTSLAPDLDSQDGQWYEWLGGLYPTHQAWSDKTRTGCVSASTQHD